MTKGKRPFSRTPTYCILEQSPIGAVRTVCACTHVWAHQGLSQIGLVPVSRTGFGMLVSAPPRPLFPKRGQCRVALGRSHLFAILRITEISGTILVAGVSNTVKAKQVIGCKHLICSYVTRRWIFAFSDDGAYIAAHF